MGRIPNEECVFCGKGFKYYIELETHMNKHTKERPYECTECDVSFPYQSSLYLHDRKVHPGRCFTCKRTFGTAERLKKHRKSHPHPRSLQVSSKEKKAGEKKNPKKTGAHLAETKRSDVIIMTWSQVSALIERSHNVVIKLQKCDESQEGGNSSAEKTVDTTEDKENEAQNGVTSDNIQSPTSTAADEMEKDAASKEQETTGDNPDDNTGIVAFGQDASCEVEKDPAGLGAASSGDTSDSSSLSLTDSTVVSSTNSEWDLTEDRAEEDVDSYVSEQDAEEETEDDSSMPPPHLSPVTDYSPTTINASSGNYTPPPRLSPYKQLRNSTPTPVTLEATFDQIDILADTASSTVDIKYVRRTANEQNISEDEQNSEKITEAVPLPEVRNDDQESNEVEPEVISLTSAKCTPEIAETEEESEAESSSEEESTSSPPPPRSPPTLKNFENPDFVEIPVDDPRVIQNVSTHPLNPPAFASGGGVQHLMNLFYSIDGEITEAVPSLSELQEMRDLFQPEEEAASEEDEDEDWVDCDSEEESDKEPEPTQGSSGNSLQRGSNGLKCTLCGKWLKHASSLKRHIMLLHSERQRKHIPCDYCDVRFSLEDNLRAHVRRIHQVK